MTSSAMIALKGYSVPVIVLEPGGAVVAWNRACSELTARELDDVRGVRFWELLSVPEEATRCRSAIGALEANRHPGTFETTWVLDTGERLTIDFAGSLVSNAETQLDHIVLTGVDVTDTLARHEADLTRLRALLEQAPDGIFVADLDGRYTDVNDAGCRLLGYSRAEILGKRITDLIPPEDAGRLWASREEMLGGRVHVAEWRLRRKDGSVVPVEVSAKILPDGRWQGLVRDVTRRLRAAEALRISEERLRVSLAGSPAVVWNQDLELRYTWIHNPRQPFVASQVLGRTDSDLLPSEEAEHLTRLKRRVLETGVGSREVARTTFGLDTTYYDLTVEPLFDAAGRVVGITCAAWDVTERQQMEDQQRFLAEAGAVLMSATPDYQAILSQLARLAVRSVADWFLIEVIEDEHVRRVKVACSDPARAAVADALEHVDLDPARHDIMGEPLIARRAIMISDVTDDQVRSFAQGPAHLELLRAIEMRSLIALPLVARDHLIGAIALVSSRRSRRYGERDLRLAGELARIAALAIDNAQLHHSAQRAIAAREEILGVVAHDLRDPLGAVLAQLELLRHPDGATEGDSPTRLDAIQRAAVRMDRLIQDLLDVARIEIGGLTIQRKPVGIRALLAEALQAHYAEAAQAGLRIRLDVSEPLHDVSGDHDRLLQVLDNLIGNAIKFTPPGGEVVVGATPGADEVIIRVTDTGIGIPLDSVPRLFDRFWQADRTDRRGAGLGLPIVRGLVAAHGGRVWAESVVGKGSTFYFTLPLASAVEASVSPPSTPREVGEEVGERGRARVNPREPDSITAQQDDVRRR